MFLLFFFFFFFQAEDGIRDKLVTGVQTCALPICLLGRELVRRPHRPVPHAPGAGRASVRRAPRSGGRRDRVRRPARAAPRRRTGRDPSRQSPPRARPSRSVGRSGGDGARGGRARAADTARAVERQPGELARVAEKGGAARGVGGRVARGHAARSAGSVRRHLAAGEPELPGAAARRPGPARAGHHGADGPSRLCRRRSRGLGRLHRAARPRAGRAHAPGSSGAVPGRALPADSLRSPVASSSACIASHAATQGMPLRRWGTKIWSFTHSGTISTSWSSIASSIAATTAVRHGFRSELTYQMAMPVKAITNVAVSDWWLNSTAYTRIEQKNRSRKR